MKKSFLIATAAAMVLASCGGDNGNYPDGLPRAFRTQPKDGPMPEYISEADSSAITVTFLGEMPEAWDQLNVSLVSTSDYNELPPMPIDSTGVVKFTVMVPGSSYLYIGSQDYGKRYGNVWVKPGEDTEVYIDNRPDSIRGNGRVIYTNGFYSNFNAMLSAYEPAHILSPFSSLIGSYDMTGDDYIAEVTKAYNDSLAAIEADTVPGMIKEIERAALKAGLTTMTAVEFVNRGTYAMAHPDDPRVNPDSVRLVIEPRHIEALYALDDFNDKAMLMNTYIPLSIGFVTQDFSLGGTRTNLITDITAFQNIVKRASSGRLTGEDIATLQAMDNGAFYVDVARKAQAGYEAKFNEAAKLIKQLPEGTPGDKIIETIAAENKGKVVVIDLWNTWCGPCKAAIAKNEPVKDTELTDPDIVWVYIADDSSAMNLYVGMIPGIRGDHYRISSDQAKALHQQFGVDGIPYYIIVDRKGNFEGRPDLRDHELYKQTVRDLLAKDK